MTNMKINERGHLEIGGCDCVELAERFSTPLYVYDEGAIRTMMRVYRDALFREYGSQSLVLYASKAFSCKGIYAIAESEGFGADVVSGGELYTALKAGFPGQKVVMHGNNKLKSELSLAVESGVQTVVLDSLTEADALDGIAGAAGKRQEVLIRINPGVEAHTHAYVQTATSDSKFGFSVQNGDAENAVKYVLGKRNLLLKGFHCHIGSQIFEDESFAVAAKKCVRFMADVKKKLGFLTATLNLGGGYGIRYTDDDPDLSPSDYCAFVATAARAVKSACLENDLPLPFLCLEPGRSIVGRAGITLYRVGAIKVAGVRKYLALDGGMFEAPRFALYRSRYAAVLANRAGDQPTECVTLAGKCCESGDMIAENVSLPRAEIGDVVAVFSTGAYHYSMASNYNRNPVPPVVLVNEGRAEYLVKPQSYEDIVRNDVIPKHLSKRG